MTILAIIITIFLEQQRVLVKPRLLFTSWLRKYLAVFTRRSFTNQRVIRYAYLFACLPIGLVLLLLAKLLNHHPLLYLLFTLIVFMFSVNILAWRNQSKQQERQSVNSDCNHFITTYATEFFAPLFWFFVFPAGVGAVCYLIITRLSLELKRKGLDLVVYNVVVDKMLFYANFIPYLILYIFIAIAGDFESVFHHILEKRKQSIKSFYALDNTLREATLLAIGKDKFQISHAAEGLNDTESGIIYQERFDPQITEYIVAVLYRSSIFFVGSLALLAIVHLFSYIL